MSYRGDDFARTLYLSPEAGPLFHQTADDHALAVRVNGHVFQFSSGCTVPASMSIQVCADILSSWRWEDTVTPRGMHGDRLYIPLE
jgi:hypothetical protein